jgi:hypothetical protein
MVDACAKSINDTGHFGADSDCGVENCVEVFSPLRDKMVVFGLIKDVAALHGIPNK